MARREGGATAQFVMLRVAEQDREEGLRFPADGVEQGDTSWSFLTSSHWRGWVHQHMQDPNIFLGMS